MTLSAALASLALSAFISATLFPGASEAGLAAVIAAWPESWPSAVVKNLPNLSQTGGRFNLALQQIRKSAEVQRPR